MKRLTSLVLIIATLLALGCFSVSNAKSFTDVPYTHWAYDYVAEMSDRGIVKGYEDGTYRPGNKVTRSEWAKLLTATAGIEIYENYKAILNCVEDVSEADWYAEYAVTVMPYLDYKEVEKGGEYIVSFEPSREATRLEITKSIVKEKGYDIITPDESLISGFSDFSSIPEADKKYVAAAVKEGIITGFNDNTFRPFDSLTRAEAATMLYRAYIKDDVDGEGEDKPYRTSKLATAGTTAPAMATMDNHRNLYYIDSRNNCVYKINLDDRQKTLYFDANELTAKNGTTKYSSYLATQVFYDEKTGTILLNGIYQVEEKQGRAPEEKQKIVYVYDITKNDDVKKFLNLERKDDDYYIQAVLDNEYILMNYADEIYKVDIETGKEKSMGNPIHDNGRGSLKMPLVRIYGNNIYCACWVNSPAIYKYDFSENDFVNVHGNSYVCDYVSLVGLKGGFYYFWSSRAKKMYKYSLKDQSINEISITFLPEYIDVTDMSGFDNLGKALYVADDETIVFYDYNLEAYRVLEANKKNNSAIDVSAFFYKYER